MRYRYTAATFNLLIEDSFLAINKDASSIASLFFFSFGLHAGEVDV
jgi:hypothetical protein